MAMQIIKPKPASGDARTPLPTDRRIIKQWLRELVIRLGRTTVHFGALTTLAPEWLDLAIDPTHDCCPSVDVVRQICRALRITAPDSILSAATRLTDAARPLPRAHANKPGKQPFRGANVTRRRLGRTLDLSALSASCRTALDELDELMQRAARVCWAENTDRNLCMIKRRVGLGFDDSSSLEEVGTEHGLTRERVRQIEDILFCTLSSKLSSIETPCVDAVITELRMAGGMGVEAFTANFKHILGNTSLPSILLVLSRIRDVNLIDELQLASIGRSQSVTLIGTESDAALANMTAIQTHRMQSFSGAVSFDVLRRKLEAPNHTPVAASRVYSIIDLLPNIVWLDDSKSWFWQTSEPASGLIRTASVICSLAHQPVTTDTLYAGLIREYRRTSPAELAEFGAAVPPVSIVIRLLAGHPHFKRRYASTIEYVGPRVALPRDDSGRQCLLDCLDQRRGIATYWDLMEAGFRGGHSHWNVKNALFQCGWFERVSPGVYAIRGRSFDLQDLSDAQNRARTHLGARLDLRHERNASRRLRKASRPSVDVWAVTYAVTAALPVHGIITMPSDLFPAQMSGDYALPSGHRIGLIDGGNTVSLIKLGQDLRDVLNIIGNVVTFTFDGRNRIVTYVVCQ